MKAWIIGAIVAMCLMATSYAGEVKDIPKDDQVSWDIYHPPVDTGNCRKGICWIDNTNDDVDITVDPPAVQAMSYSGGDNGCRFSYGDESIRYETSNGNVFGYDKTGVLLYDTSGIFSQTEKLNAVVAVIKGISPRTPLACRV